VPALVERAPTTWIAYACMAVEDNPGGCGSGDPSQYIFVTSAPLVITEAPSFGVKLYGSDGNIGDQLGEAFSTPGALLGMCGTNPGSLPND
jgi:hypothetical protein